MGLSRRQFLGGAALISAAALQPRWLAAAAPEPGRSDLVARTQAARERYARVAAFINRANPVLRGNTIAAADEAMRGQLLLPGSPTLSSVGTPPAWLTPQHGDEEFLWSLHRMMHWKTLLQARALTGDDRYAGRVMEEWTDWMRQTTQPPLRDAAGRINGTIGTNAGPPAWRALETGIRMFDSWPVVWEQLAGTPHLDAGRLERMLRSVAQHGDELSLISPRLWPEADHNHYFMEMLGLLSLSVYFPELPRSDSWREQAIRELQRCVAKQFTRDGGHVEACPSYHNVCVVLLTRFLDLSRRAQGVLPTKVQALTLAAAEQTVHSVRPTGDIVPWGDSTKNNQVEAALWVYRASGDPDPLQRLAGLMGRARVEIDCAPHLWDIDEPDRLFALLSANARPAPRLRHDRDNDQVMVRSSWGREAASVFFSCHSPLVAGSGHQHIDLGGFDFTALGRALVVDPGVFTYRESEDRRLFKSSAYHSVLTIDEREPFDYVNRWRYTAQKEGRVTAVATRPGLTRVESFHRNYEPAICWRTIGLVGADMLVVVDRVESLAPTSTVQIYFHLDSPSVSWNAEDGWGVADHPEVKLAVYSSGGLQGEILPGRISEMFDVSRPSTRLKFSDAGGATERVFATVLIAFRAGESRPLISGLELLRDSKTCRFLRNGTAIEVKYA
jgi:hypothetical protein